MLRMWAETLLILHSDGIGESPNKDNKATERKVWGFRLMVEPAGPAKLRPCW